MTGEPTIAGLAVRGLTLHRPWPWTFTHLPPAKAKRVENRAWPLPRKLWRSWIALHSGKAFDHDAWDRMRKGLFGEAAWRCPGEPAHPHSVITALALAMCSVGIDTPSMRGTDHWFFGPQCWLMPEVIVLPEPVACGGKQGLWRLPPDVFDRVHKGYVEKMAAKAGKGVVL